MDLTYYARLLLRRGWIILLAVAITAGAAFALSKMQTPVYRATQRVLMQPARNDFGLTETLRILLRSWVVYLDTEQQAQNAIDRLNLDMTAGELLGYSTISSDPTQLTVQIDVDMQDGPLASRIAYELGLLLKEYRDEENRGLDRQDRIEAIVLDRATYGLHRPRTSVNTMAGGLLGLLIGGAVVFALEYLESNVVRRKEDVERFLELPVLAAIPADDARS